MAEPENIIRLGEGKKGREEATAEVRRLLENLITLKPKTIIIIAETGEGDVQTIATGSVVDVLAVYQVGRQSLEEMLRKAIDPANKNG